MYSSRQAKILSIALLRDEYITYQDISNELQISTRTIMREINQIKDTLQRFNLELLSKKGKGICIKGCYEDKQKLIMYIQDAKIDYMDKEERRELLCLELLRIKDIEKIFYYSNKFQVSEATISHDLDYLQPYLETFQIQLIRKPGFGVGIKGKEENIRQAISTIINHTIQHHIMNIDFNRYNLSDILDQIQVTKNSNIKKLLDKDILSIILEVFKTHHQELELDSIAKSSYMGLLIHLMIAIHRMKEGQQIQKNEDIYQLIHDQHAYQKAKKMVEYLAQAFSIEIDDIECVFIAIHLQSAKSAIIKEEEVIDEYHEVIMQMIMVFKKYGYHLLNDYELYQSLATHLKPALVRLKFHLPIYNPLLSQIKNDFKTIFEMCEEAGKCVSEVYGYELNDHEVGYLALHFAAAIERYKISNVRKIQVGIVCSSGIGLSALLMARLKRVVDHNVQLIPLSIDQVQNHTCELLISTFDIEQAIIVSPLLDQKDIMKVLDAIETCRNQSNINHPTKQTYDFIELSALMKQLIEDIKLYILPHTCDSKTLIEIASSHITKHHELVQQILAREEKGSNIYKLFHFALFHCASEFVDRCVVHIIRSDQERFDCEDLSGIQVVLFMLIPKQASMVEKRMMSFISSQLIENSNFLTTLIEKEESIIKEEFQHVLQKWIIQMVQEEI